MVSIICRLDRIINTKFAFFYERGCSVPCNVENVNDLIPRNEPYTCASRRTKISGCFQCTATEIT